MLKIKNLNSAEKLFLVFILALVIYKIFILAVKGPLLPPDSIHYIEYSQKILSFMFASPDAIRTPGYPLFISLFFFGGKYILHLVVISQIILGLLSLYILYKFFKEHKIRLAVLPVLFMIYISPISFSELEILTESLTFFLLVVSLLLLFKKNAKLQDIILLVFLTIYLIIVRPQYGILLPILCIYLFFKIDKLRPILIIIFSILTIMIYSYFNYISNNYFGMTSLTSFNLVNHTGYYIEKARDINPELVDIYVSYRDERMKDSDGQQEFTFGTAKDTIMSKLNMNYIQLSKEMDKINFYLITHYPLEYLKTFYYSFKNLFTYDYYGYKATMPAKILIMISKILFVTGLILSFLKFKDRNVIVRSLLILFYASILFAVITDTGETFRHIIPVTFIPFIFIGEFINKIRNVKRTQEDKRTVSVS